MDASTKIPLLTNQGILLGNNFYIMYSAYKFILLNHNWYTSIIWSIDEYNIYSWACLMAVDMFGVNCSVKIFCFIIDVSKHFNQIFFL